MATWTVIRYPASRAYPNGHRVYVLNEQPVIDLTNDSIETINTSNLSVELPILLQSIIWTPPDSSPESTMSMLDFSTISSASSASYESTYSVESQ